MIKRILAYGALCLAFGLAGTGGEQASSGFDGLFRAGQAHQEAGRQAEARATYEHALAVAGITSAQAAQTWLAIAATHIAAYQWQPANAAFERVLALEDAPPASTAQAYLGIARVFSNYGGEWGWGKVTNACTRVLALPESSAEQTLAARQTLARALMGLKQRGAARLVLRDIVAMPDLPAGEQIATRILLAKIALLEQDFDGARTALDSALTLEGVSDADRADIQLQRALSYYDAGDYERAKPELMKVREMPGAGARRTKPGQDNAYSPGHEATVRLHLRNMIPREEPTIVALFIGSSMTMRGGMPRRLAAMADSAPAGRPRVVPCVFGRGGTRIDVFWNDGDEPGTARHLIAAEPWDAVVIETFYTLKPDELVTYGTRFGELVRARNAAPVFYVSPAARAHPYPDAHRLYQDAVVELAQALSAPVAPAVGAYIAFLGENPAPDRFGVVYNDWIHATENGNHLIASCIYAALTGFSPVGLAHPGLSETEAHEFQEAAWEAYGETRKVLSIDSGPDSEQ